MKIYGDWQSGNCYKIALVCELLALPYQWVNVDILAGDTKSPSFLAMNPTGKIPLLALDDGRFLSESNAILNYLAAGSALYPSDVFSQAKIQQWQFFEQYSHEPYIAVARFIAKYLNMPDERREEFASKQLGGHQALAVMEQALADSPFLLGEQFTTADISLFAYTHVAEEGGFDLSLYPNIGAWLARIQAQPKFKSMAA